MNDRTTYKTAPHQGSTDECCTGSKCESGLRNNYFEGKRLTADSFRVEQDYTLGRRRLLNRAMFGWGVVYGYKVTPVTLNDPKKKVACELKIGPGLALDTCGRELLQGETIIRTDDLIIDEADKHENKQWWLLSVHYAERGTENVKIEDRCRCEHDEWDHTCETVRYSLQPVDKCCTSFDCELTCGCGTGDCCEEPKGVDTAEHEDKRPKPYERPNDPDTTHKRGGCRCLCDYLTNFQPPGECVTLCERLEPCGGSIMVDLKNGVPLACVERIQDADCDQWAFGSVEACGPRRLVKRNDLLFDLIRGCDLTRISKIGWAKWHRSEEPISFAEFLKAFEPHAKENYETPGFWVEFSRDVRADTLRADCFAMTVISSEFEGGWWQTLRVPIIAVDTTYFPSMTGDPKYVTGCWIVLDDDWIQDALKGRKTIFHVSNAQVELEVRGDFIVDCNGQTVDANAVGRPALPTGNGTPGGTFLSAFRVAMRVPPTQVSKEN